MRTIEVIASTMMDDIEEWKNARYQTYENPSVYTNGEHYYAVAKSKPKHVVGAEWEKHPDQFWASKTGKFLWVSKQI